MQWSEVRALPGVLPERRQHATQHSPSGAMDTASAYGAEDSRFESWEGFCLIAGSTEQMSTGHFSLAGVVVT
jgi:hypothetical protein